MPNQPAHITVETIVSEWLRNHGYDGLTDGKDCSCWDDSLLGCEGEGCYYCVAGCLAPHPNADGPDDNWMYIVAGPRVVKKGD